MQVFADGHVRAVDGARSPAPVLLGPAAVCFARTSRKFRVTVEPGGAVYLVGLDPGHTYQVEVDDEEMFEADSDRAGILAVEVPAGRKVGVRIRNRGYAPDIPSGYGSQESEVRSQNALRAELFCLLTSVF